jgi:hypothetical protein
MNHPKFTLEATNDFYNPFQLREHITAIDPADNQTKVMSQVVGRYKRLEEAFLDMAMRSGQPVIIAVSQNPIDNTFTV